MQPLVGVITDRSTSKWGRRRPFMIAGSFIVSFCLLILGWTSEIVGMFISDESRKKSVTVAVAVLGIYAADFAINIVQASCRSLIVDTLPIPQQQLGSAWASRMTAIGHLLGYVMGSVNMLSIFGHGLGDTQFKQITVIAAMFLIFAVSVTSYAVKERVLISGFAYEDGSSQDTHPIVENDIQPTSSNTGYLLGPILGMDRSTWVGETHFRYEAPEDAAEKSSDTLGDVARIGSLSLVIFSIITFISSVVLPFGVLSPDNKKSAFVRRPPLGLVRLFNKLHFTRPDLQTTWMISHIVFALTMIFAPAARSVQFATTLVAICGIPWAVTCWAPFAFMGVEINRLEIRPFTRKSSVTMITSATFNGHNSDLSSYDTELEDRGPSVLRLNHSHSQDVDSDSETDGDDDDEEEEEEEEASSTGELAGIYLGVLNVYTTLPQFAGTLISWIVFSILEPGTSPIAADENIKDGASSEHDGEWINRHREGPNAIAVCLFIGALSSLVAAEATRRLKYAR
ncbi:hypothetical protein ACJ72_04340 [Emergomyces africanus]|uniref:Sucrose transporter n=1 Tax=Emergomyces africanus TaxID=1955775 RepID=A0A1B7NX21_9EURO|nr:hypothetical protein ACJ72_04340 [Emergomyces africanus]